MFIYFSELDNVRYLVQSEFLINLSTLSNVLPKGFIPYGDNIIS